MINPKIKVEAFKNPIRHWVIRNFLTEPEILLREVKSLPFNRKECDLFQFYQGEDLKNTDNRILEDFYKEFSSKAFLANIGTITGTKLTHIDMSPFIYSDTDHLLPHDDKLEGRRVAYALYLNSLNKVDGGSLDFFKDSLVHQKITPERGMLVLFEVTPRSVHQVSEVIKKERVSLAGWFNG